MIRKGIVCSLKHAVILYLLVIIKNITCVYLNITNLDGYDMESVSLDQGGLDLVTQKSSALELEVINQSNTETTEVSTDIKNKDFPKRKYVKLTMKQGLIMNQVIGVYALSNTQNILCKNQTEEFKAAVRAFEPWALHMLDSSSKLQAGLLFGNLMEYGSYEECVNIHKHTVYGLIRGQMCTLKVHPGPKLIRQILALRGIPERRFDKLMSSVMDGVKLGWSVCIPESCKSADILPHFNQSIKEMTHGLQLEVSLTDADCTSIKDHPNFGYKSFLALALLSFVPLNVFIASLLEWKTGGTRNTYVDIFSAYSNGKQLFYKTDIDSELDCLHGIRFLSICYVLFGHRFQMGLTYPSVNSLYLIDWILNYTSAIVIGGTVCVDSFLFVSSTLVSYNFFNSVTKQKKFNIFGFYVYRYLRITLSYTVVMFCYAFLIQHLGSGPLWHATLSSLQEPCIYFWWSTLLYIQPYINPSTMCIVQTWYLCVEMVYYYFSPVILYPLWKWPSFAYLNFVGVYALSLGTSFYFAWENKYEGGMPLTSQLLQTKFFTKYYITPHTRASPYIIGLGFGYALFKIRGEKVNINKLTTVVGWLSAIAVMLFAVLSVHVFVEETYEYNRLEASLFQAMVRSGWVLGISWIIWACVTGYGGLVNEFLSLHLFRVLGRISYGIFLLHMGTQFIKEGSAKVSGYYSNYEMIYRCLADLGLVTILSTIFTILFEMPFNNITRLIIIGDQRTKIQPEEAELVQVVKPANREKVY